MLETLVRGARPTAGLTCVCCHCRRERTEANEWREHSPVTGERLSHGICPDCLYELYPDVAPLVRPREVRPALR
jgi:hypothetical protein